MDIKYKSEDFEGLLFNVHKVPTNRSIFTAFPEMKGYPEFKEDLDSLQNHKNKVLRYVVYNYDGNSPIVKDIDDVIKRKIASIKMAGFKTKEDGRFDETVDQMLRGYNQVVNRMIIRYCRLQYPMEYSLIVTGHESFYNILFELTNRSEDQRTSSINEADKKSQLFGKAEAMMTKLDDTKSRLFNKDINNGLDRDLFRVIEKDALNDLNLSPEKMAMGG